MEKTSWILLSIKTVIYPLNYKHLSNSIYNLTNLVDIRLTLESAVTETKPLKQNFKSFAKADNDAINKHLIEQPFQSVCYTNINKMSEQFTTYLDEMFNLYVSKRTRHRQSLSLWISCGISNMIKKIKTQKLLLENISTSYKKELVFKLENQVT